MYFVRSERIDGSQRIIGAYLAIHIIALPQNVASLLHTFLLIALIAHLEVKMPLEKLRLKYYTLLPYPAVIARIVILISYNHTIPS